MSQPATWGSPRAADAPVTPTDMANRIDDSLDALLTSNSGASRPAYALEGTVWYDTAIDQLFVYDGSTDVPIAMKAAIPASAAATGRSGQVTWDADYIYVCTATDTWKRVAIATW